MTVPSEAVEAALDAWGKWPEGVSAREQAARILEAAAPHMLAAAWDEGIEAGVDVSVPECDYARNPYRTLPEEKV